jgi:hypothetical protein
MTGKEYDRVKRAIENEGFDYTFHDYDDFLDIKDAKFHRLRERFLKARAALALYVGQDES